MFSLKKDVVIANFNSVTIKFVFHQTLLCEISQYETIIRFKGRKLAAFLQFFLSHYYVVCKNNPTDNNRQYVIYNFEKSTELHYAWNIKTGQRVAREATTLFCYTGSTLILYDSGSIIAFSPNEVSLLRASLKDNRNHGFFYQIYQLQLRNGLWSLRERVNIGTFFKFAAHRIALAIFREFSPRCVIRRAISVISWNNRRDVMTAICNVKNDQNEKSFRRAMKFVCNAVSHITGAYIAGILLGSHEYGKDLTHLPFAVFCQDTHYAGVIDDLLCSEVVAAVVTNGLLTHLPNVRIINVNGCRTYVKNNPYPYYDRLGGKRVWRELNEFVHFPLSEQTDKMLTMKFDDLRPCQTKNIYNIKFKKPLAFNY